MNPFYEDRIQMGPPTPAAGKQRLARVLGNAGSSPAQSPRNRIPRLQGAEDCEARNGTHHVEKNCNAAFLCWARGSATPSVVRRA